MSRRTRNVAIGDDIGNPGSCCCLRYGHHRSLMIGACPPHLFLVNASRVVFSRMQLTLHATRRTPHGAPRLLHAMSIFCLGSENPTCFVPDLYMGMRGSMVRRLRPCMKQVPPPPPPRLMFDRVVIGQTGVRCMRDLTDLDQYGQREGGRRGGGRGRHHNRTQQCVCVFTFYRYSDNTRHIRCPH